MTMAVLVRDFLEIFLRKDSSLEYLRARNKDGQSVESNNATHRESRLKTGAGVTAYDGRPIPEVYKPATSQGSVPPDAVEISNEPEKQE